MKLLKYLENEFVFSKKFSFAPTQSRVLLHCDGLDPLCDIYLNGTHVAYTDNMHRAYELRNNTGAVIKEGCKEVSVPALSVLWLDEMDFEKTDVEHNYISYELTVDEKEVSCGTALFTTPNHFEFSDPILKFYWRSPLFIALFGSLKSSKVLVPQSLSPSKPI